jgi:flagellar biosynthesis protein FlhG
LDHGGTASFGLPPHEGSILDVLGGRRSLHEVLQRGPSGIQVVAGVAASQQLRDFAVPAQQRLIAELKNLAPHADVVVIDAGSSRTVMAQRFWQSAESVMLVTTDDSLSIMDSYAAVKAMLGLESKVPLHVLVNRPPNGAEAAGVQARIAEACQRFLGLQAQPAGSVPICDSPAGVDGVLVYPPRSESARAMDRAAELLWVQLQQVSAQGSGNPTRPRQDASG